MNREDALKPVDKGHADPEIGETTYHGRRFRYFLNEPSWRLKPSGPYFSHPWGTFGVELIERCLEPRWDVLDIGANVGMYTVPLARTVTGAVHAFEPHPDNLELLRENTGNMRDVTVHGCALGHRNGESDLNLSRGAPGGHSLIGDKKATIRVPLCRLDDLSIPGDFIKCDVEGFAHHVVEGGFKTFSRAQLILFELHAIPVGDQYNVGEYSLIPLFFELGFDVLPIRFRGVDSRQSLVWERLKGLLCFRGTAKRFLSQLNHFRSARYLSLDTLALAYLGQKHGMRIGEGFR